MGLNSRMFSLDGQLQSGAELTTWIVAEKYQGGGAGPQILEYIQNSYDVLIGMGISDAALPIYMRYGFRFLRAIPRFVRIFDFNAAARISNHAPLARKLFRKWSREPAAASYTVSEGIDEHATLLFESVRKDLNLYCRDYKNLEWRYAKHPFFTYRLFIVKPLRGKGSALVCVREETSVHGLRLLHVTDCFGDDDAMTSAVEFIDDYCKANLFHVADFFSTSSRINRHMLATGWFSTMDDLCFQFPHLFHPVELRTPPTTSLAYWSRNRFVDFCDLSKLYITKQDADLDRPMGI